jgi:sialidase-1
VPPSLAYKLRPGAALWFTERVPDGRNTIVSYDIRGSLLYKINHSCEPNCHVRHAPGERVAVVALQPLEEGAEVTIDYLAGSDVLLPRLWFKCRCALCDRRARQTTYAVGVMISTPPLVLSAAIFPRCFCTLFALLLPLLLTCWRRRAVATQQRSGGEKRLGGQAIPVQPLAATGAPAPVVAPAEPCVARVTVFESNASDGTGPVFRIPALLRLPPSGEELSSLPPAQSADGPGAASAATAILLAFVEQRESVRDWGRIDLVLRRSTDGGRSWADIQRVLGADDLDFDDRSIGASLLARGLTVGNPCPVWEARSRTVYLLVTVNCAEDNESAIISRAALDTRRVFVATSNDLGVSWSRAREVTSSVKRGPWTVGVEEEQQPRDRLGGDDGGAGKEEERQDTDPRQQEQQREDGWTWYATGPGGAIQLSHGPHAGRLLWPCNHSHTTPDGYVRRAAHVLYADPRGEAGEELELKIGGCADAHSNESTLALAADRTTLLLNARDMSGRCVRWTAASIDGGESWHKGTQPGDLIEPAMHGCHAALERCAGPRARLAFANPRSTRRERLTVRWSDDDGQTWADALLVHSGPSAYCSLQALPETEAGAGHDDALAILFECGARGPYERIDFAIVHSRSESHDQSQWQAEALAHGAAAADEMYGAWG